MRTLPFIESRAARTAVAAAGLAAVTMALFLVTLPADAGSLAGLAGAVGQFAAGQNGSVVGNLVTQQDARGPYNQVGLACTYNVQGQMVTVFQLAFCPIQMSFN
jgi:hypothetical protein